MRCINCDGEDFNTFIVETYPCTKCGGGINVEYSICKECRFVFKSVDGKVITGALLLPEDMDEQMFSDEGIKEMFKFLDDADMCLNIDNLNDVEKSFMEDYIHRCLKCNTVCYEIGEGNFTCPKCSFEWEVV